MARTKNLRELIWVLGMAIYLVLMAEGFMGYVLPWGQMSYWGANVIVSLFGSIPIIGEDLLVWIRGDYLISGATLNRFFALHVVALPIVLLALVVLHILALHEVGSITLTASISRIRKALMAFLWMAYRSTHITRSITISLA